MTGCTKVSQGCKNCYAERMWPRLATGRPFTEVLSHPERLTIPLHWKKPRRIFVNSMSDMFHENVPDEFIDHVFAVMALCPQHTFQVLTKRPWRMFNYMNSQDEWMGDAPSERIRWLAGFLGSTVRPEEKIHWPISNVWLGVSVEDQAAFDKRWPHLRDTPAAVRFISYEPALGPLSIRSALLQPACVVCSQGVMDNGNDHMHGRCSCHCHADQIRPDWIICGGESGPHARPMHPDWARALRDQCRALGVPFFFKQWGEYAPACLASWREQQAIYKEDVKK